jgi:predicted O-methyltransferase YrrM
MLYIGDVSKTDALVLQKYAKLSSSVLEFGPGASTQIIAQSMKEEGTIDSFETEQKWIDLNIKTLQELDCSNKCSFHLYKCLSPFIEDNVNSYDLVFVDGLNELRLEFALSAWSTLKVGGVMIFHDTRKQPFATIISKVLEKHFEEIESIKVNELDSNMSVITKTPPHLFDNWNSNGKRLPWMWTPLKDKPSNWRQILEAYNSSTE